MPRPSASSAEKTARTISEGIPVIYEACFIHEEVIIAIDLLVKQEVGWNAYEVKSSLALSETYYNDAYIQEFVIRGSGLDLNEFFLVHRNADVQQLDELDVNNLFIFTRLPDGTEELSSTIRNRLEIMKNTLLLKSSPSVSPGKHCMYPYPCDFRGVCWKGLSEEEKTALLEGK